MHSFATHPSGVEIIQSLLSVDFIPAPVTLFMPDFSFSELVEARKLQSILPGPNGSKLRIHRVQLVWGVNGTNAFVQGVEDTPDESPFRLYLICLDDGFHLGYLQKECKQRSAFTFTLASS